MLHVITAVQRELRRRGSGDDLPVQRCGCDAMEDCFSKSDRQRQHCKVLVALGSSAEQLRCGGGLKVTPWAGETSVSKCGGVRVGRQHSRCALERCSLHSSGQS